MNKTLIKICGITNLDDAGCALEQNVDFLGFCFVRKSPRYIAPDCAEWIIQHLPENQARKVGVFVNTPVERIKEIAVQCDLDIIQLHGDETPEISQSLGTERVWKALPVWNNDDLQVAMDFPAAAILVDSITLDKRGGTGQVGDWELTAHLAHKRNVVLAGGLTPDNVKAAVRVVQPYAVDVCSGIEKSPGLKDYDRMRQFVKNAGGNHA
ncbi:MAG: phosphoribosylanthranilate isomerase [Lentisphaeria bacterium]